MAAVCNRSNLQRFLDSVTPSLESQVFFRPPNFRDSSCSWWCKQDFVEYYVLSDLWGSLREWSAYGASTDVMLPDGDTIVQYFMPCLSAIQLYTNDASSLMATSNFVMQNRMYWSANEFYKQQLSQSARSSWNSLPIDFGKLNLGDVKKNLGFKCFEYFETASPFTRMPIVDKVQRLAHSFPGLYNFKSIDLSSSSWMAISWYPIYTIPSQLDRETFASCFLTYHRLSPSQDDDTHEETVTPEIASRKGKEPMQLDQNKGKQKKKSMTVSLPPFALASHKLNGALWNNSETGDSDLTSSLLCAAGSWLRKVQAQHHDFDFFIAHKEDFPN